MGVPIFRPGKLGNLQGETGQHCGFRDFTRSGAIRKGWILV
jgi:hypothetical protein